MKLDATLPVQILNSFGLNSIRSIRYRTNINSSAPNPNKNKIVINDDHTDEENTTDVLSETIEIVTRKAKINKKNRLKSKFLKIIPTINRIKNYNVPECVKSAIKTSKFELFDFDKNQQESIVEIGRKLSTKELAILLLSLPETTEEMIFVKETFLNKENLERIFKTIDLSSI